MTVEIGLWVLPLLVTLGSFGFVVIAAGRSVDLAGGIAFMIGSMVALIASLIAWLIWALVA